jgi:ABC-2 type transport system ATP-binding protein
MEKILAVRDIRKHFEKVRAVDGVSFDVRRGTITGLLGRNGAGKTTAIRMINGIFLPDSGEIELWGMRDGALSARDRIGYLPEERGLYKQMKVFEQLLFLAEIKSKSGPATRKSTESWLRRLELWDKKDAKIEELSKGNQQKVQLIGALLHDPELVILDEPMSGLDPVNVVLVREILLELKAAGKTLLLSTHMMGEAEKTVDDIVLIHDGKVVLGGDLAEIKAGYGRNTAQISFDGDGSFLPELPGVARANMTNNGAELLLEAGTDPQAILLAAVARLRVLRWELAAPSLEEIFIDRVGTETLATAHAGAAEGGAR